MKEKRNYKPTRLADSIGSLNKKFVNKFGEVNFIIFSKWPKIVGSFFELHSEPVKITTIPNFDVNNEYSEKILHVNVAPAAALEFQHFQNKVIEKINSFLGYKAIHHIKIHQKFKYIKKNNTEKIENKLDKKKIEIKDTTQKINDKELKQSLLNLRLSIEGNDKN
tara:strand:- start:3933 stop:4427 length:495 start_codon:yes stop_codon:yes gene_type:complete